MHAQGYEFVSQLDIIIIALCRKRYYLQKMQGYADNDLEFEETAGQYTIANESLVSHNISSIVHGESLCVVMGAILVFHSVYLPVCQFTFSGA